MQALFNKANEVEGDVMRWSDFLSVLTQFKHPNTPPLTVKPPRFSDLPVFANDAQAGAGGLTDGELYRTATGDLRVKNPGP